MQKDKFKMLVVNGILAILVFYISLVIGEILLRALYPQDLLTNVKPDIYENDKLLGWTYKKNSSFNILSPDSRELVHLNFNSDGFRHDSYITDKKKILLIGDSTTGAIQVNITDHFGTIINQKFPEYQVINAGVNGYSTDQAYLLMSKLMNEHDIHLVIYLFNPNDVPGNLFRDINVGIYRYGKPFFDIDNGVLKNNSYKTRMLRDNILIDRALMYEMEYNGFKDIVKVIEQSSIFGKSYTKAKTLRKAAKGVFGEDTGKIVVDAIMTVAMNPPTVRKVLRRREEVKLIKAPSVWSFFVTRKKFDQIFSKDYFESKKFDSDNLYKDITSCPSSYRSQRTPSAEIAWNITELLLDSMQKTSKKNNVPFIIVPTFDYIAKYNYLTYIKEINKLNECQVDKIHIDIKNAAKKYNIPVVTEVLELAKERHSNKEHYNFKNNEGRTINGHYSKKGHKITAEGIIKHIETNKLLQ
jgi:hypothetical protein